VQNSKYRKLLQLKTDYAAIYLVRFCFLYLESHNLVNAIVRGECTHHAYCIGICMCWEIISMEVSLTKCTESF